ncbi:MAG: hypothetical protein NZM09_04655 [Ignavibacterium sp.]|nr:hypothetical protein [Ignavibacterium sp.]MDW8374967.1 hypothetical protein [Ignavibacteriales bacterium]
MKKIIFIVATLTFVTLYSETLRANKPYHLDGYFYSCLTPYGTWILLDHGVYAWRPTIIVKTWAPYKIGRWVWTDYGWYWDSYEPFGVIVYHYGRWHYDDYYGWIWIPDYEWAPAWVEWRYDDDYIGWAPLPPYAVFKPYYGVIYTYSYAVPVIHWHYVKIKYFCKPYVYKYYVPEKVKYRVHQNTKYRNEYRYSNGRVINQGVEYDFIRKRTNDNIQKRELTIVDNPRIINEKSDRDKNRIETFIADRDKILKDRETIRNAEIIRENKIKPSIELSRVELAETRYKNEISRKDDRENSEREDTKLSRRVSDIQSRDDNRKDFERNNYDKKEDDRIIFNSQENDRIKSERKENQRNKFQIFSNKNSREDSDDNLNKKERDDFNTRERSLIENFQFKQERNEIEKRDNNRIIPRIDDRRDSRDDRRRNDRNENLNREPNSGFKFQQRNEQRNRENIDNSRDRNQIIEREERNR